MAPSLYPHLPSTAPEKDRSHWGRSPNSGRLTSKEAGTPSTALCALLQAPGPPLPQADRSYTAGPTQYVYQPFTTTALLNWQQHQPHWDDGRQLMSTLFTSDEHQRVYQAARAWLVTQAPPQTANPERWADERIPDTRPDWDPNSSAAYPSCI
jgi:hypothetical protein